MTMSEILSRRGWLSALVDNSELVVPCVEAQQLVFFGLISNHRNFFENQSHGVQAILAAQHHDSVWRGPAHLGVVRDAVEVKARSFDRSLFD